jgi:hypothetical protein
MQELQKQIDDLKKLVEKLTASSLSEDDKKQFQQMKKDVDELNNWKKLKTDQQITLPLDNQSKAIILSL